MVSMQTDRRRCAAAVNVAALLCVALILCGCSAPQALTTEQVAAANEAAESAPPSEYKIGPGDTLQVFVWRNPELSVTVPVRPDGKISIPLVDDLRATGRSPTELAQEIKARLGTYIRDPEVTVIITGFVGNFDQQVRVIGQATKPQALPYRRNMTLLDVMIQVGGLTDFAAGNRAKIVRRVEGTQSEIPVRLDDLLRGGDVGADMAMYPGDILIVPEAWF